MNRYWEFLRIQLFPAVLCTRFFACFIIILISNLMSASLPRLKTVHQLNKHSSQHNVAPPLKFRKITIESSQNGEERKKSVRTIKTERLKSLERYSTVQEQRQYKNQKIHLNLIERKLLNGTYDEKKETGNELNIIKQKRDHIRVESNLKQRQAERVKYMLVDVKKEIQDILAHKGDADKKLNELKEKWQAQAEKTVHAKENHSVLEEMFKIRHDINLNLCKRHNDSKSYLSHIQSTMSLIDTELRELTQKVASRQVKLQELLKRAMRQRTQRNEQIAKHQERISRRKEDEVLQSEKSKQYVAHLDELDRAKEIKQFDSYYMKILANLLASKYMRSKMTDLESHYEKYEYSYKKLCSYRSFNSEEPKELVTRFFQHGKQKEQREHLIKQKETILQQLQAKNQQLKKQYMEIEIQLLQSSQKLSNSLLNVQSEERKEQLATLQNEAREADEKSDRVKRALFRMLGSLQQRADKRLAGSEPALSNISLISNVVLDLAKNQE